MSKKEYPKRVLVFRLGSLGDTVVALPAFHLLARVWPQAEVRLLTNLPVVAKAAPAQAVLEKSGLMQGYFYYKVRERGLQNLLALRRELRVWRPDAVIYLANAHDLSSVLRYWLFFLLCGIPRRIGFPFAKILRRHLRNEKTGQLEHQSAMMMRALEPELGDAKLDDPANWDLRLTAEERATAARVLQPAGEREILAVCAGTKVQSKDWGLENWKQLLAKLAPLYPTHALVILGAPEEKAAGEFAASGWRQAIGEDAVVINLCGELTPRESAAALERAKLYLGHDSGPMHLAAAVGTKCVAIFAARNLPAVWFPYGEGHHVVYHKVECAGCQLETCIAQQKKCILSITVDEVLREVTAAMPPKHR